MAFRRFLQQRSSTAAAWRASTAALARRSVSTVTDPTKILTSPFPSIDIPKGNFFSFVYRQFEQHGSKAALIDGASGEQLSYNEIGEMTSKVGSALLRRGMRKGDVLAIVSPNSAAFGVQFFATVAIGCAVTTMNPTFTKTEMANQLKDSGAKFVATTSALLSLIREAATEVGIPDGNVIVLDGEGSSPHLSFRSLLEDSGSQFPVGGDSVDPEDIACLPYSSGTTGLPKGVMLTHANMISNVVQIDHPKILDMRGPSSHTLGVLPFYHIYGLSIVLASSWYQGNTIVSLPKFDPEVFLSAMAKYKVTVGYLAPPLVLFLAKHPLVDQYDLTSLNSVFSGAAPLSGNLAQAVKVRLGVREVRQGYGLTETSPVTNVCPRGVDKPSSIGSVILNTEGCVLDSETGLALGPDQVGELLVRGPQVMKGYLHRPEATAKSISEDGWFHTGDLGECIKVYVHFLMYTCTIALPSCSILRLRWPRLHSGPAEGVDQGERPTGSSG